MNNCHLGGQIPPHCPALRLDRGTASPVQGLGHRRGGRGGGRGARWSRPRCATQGAGADPGSVPGAARLRHRVGIDGISSYIIRQTRKLLIWINSSKK